MPSARKRSLREAEDIAAELPQPPSMLHQIRNMWQFANLFQFTSLFGKVLKIDDNLDIEDLEMECLSPHSLALQDIGLCFLKFLSSHRGLTHDMFEEYSRRQFLAKAPEKNPFGDDEQPIKFADFDAFKKIKILQQMSQLIMLNPERLRDKTEEQKDTEQTNWRIEPYGWDREDRTYFVLDDNRIYRLTEAPPLPPQPKLKKKNTKKARASLRASKRRRISAVEETDLEDAGDGANESALQDEEPEDDGLGGMKWECLAVTLDEVRQFISSIQKSKDSNERILREQIEDHLIPILERQEESRNRKQLQREKELLNLERMSHAKRSSRLANKAEVKKQEETVREEETRRRQEEALIRKEKQKLAKLQRERDHRLLARDNRLKERESRRQQHEEELAQLSEDSKSAGPGAGAGRLSERRLQAEIERNKQALREIEEEEEDWIFDCICGVYGQIDDGTHSVSCENCNVWQHSKCLNIAEEEADREDFHFLCDSCRRRLAEKEQRPRIIKIKVNRPGSSSSVAQKAADGSSTPRSQADVDLGGPSQTPAELPQMDVPASFESKSNGMHPPPAHLPSIPNPNASDQSHAGGAPNGATLSFGPVLMSVDRQASRPFSSPYPTLSPPDQSPHKSRVYSTIYDQSSPSASADGRPSVGTKQQTTITNQVALSPPTGSGQRPLPSKQPELPPPTATKKSSPVSPLQSQSTAASFSTTNLESSTPSSAGRSLSNPSASQTQSQETAEHERSSPLPPSRGGLSPTKHSPPFPRQSGLSNGDSSSNLKAFSPVAATTPKPAILPLIAALSPSPRQQVMTPPVKPIEPARGGLQQPQDAKM